MILTSDFYGATWYARLDDQLKSRFRKLDEARRAFLNDCSLVVSLPVTRYVEGSSTSRQAVVVPLHHDLQLGIADARHRQPKSVTLLCPGPDTDCEGFTTGVAHEGVRVIEYPDYWNVDPTIEGRVRLREVVIRSIDNSEFRLWSWLPKLWVNPDDVKTAIWLLLYCLENDVINQNTLRDAQDEVTGECHPKETFSFDLGNSTDGYTLRSLCDVFRLSWVLQRATNGASCFTQLFGARDIDNVWRYDMSLSIYEAQFQLSRKPYIDLNETFLVVDKLLGDHSVTFRLEENYQSDNELVLAYMADDSIRGATHFVGPTLLPMFRRWVRDASMRLRASAGLSHCEIKPLSEETGMAVAFWGGSAEAGEVREELARIDRCWIHYSSRMWWLDAQTAYGLERGRWDSGGARVLEVQDYGSQASSLGVVPSTFEGEATVEYARLWTNDTELLKKYPESSYEPGALAMANDDFNDLYKDKGRFQVFIVDQGEYENRSVGKIYIGGKPAFRATKEDPPVIRELTDLEYRLFDYLLRNHDHENNRYLFDLMAHCWFVLEDRIKELKDLYRKKKDEFRDETATFRNKFYQLDDILAEFGVHEVECEVIKRKYGLTPWPLFCVIHVLQRG